MLVKNILRKFLSHSINIICARGYATFLLDNTNTYSDIDFFVQNFRAGTKTDIEPIIQNFIYILSKKIDENIKFPTICRITNNRYFEHIHRVLTYTITIHNKVLNIQFIIINYSKCVTRDHYAFNVIQHFDMNKAKCAIYCDSNLIYFINNSFPRITDKNKNDLDLRLVEKYSERNLLKAFNPNSLQYLCYKAICLNFQ